MHECPDCGQACCCNGDIENHDNPLEAENCNHDCDEREDESWFTAEQID